MRSGVGMSHSKKVLKAAEQQRPDVTQKRRWWNILVQSKACRRLVFFDETGADTKMTRRYGWGPRSSRVVGHVPQGHWKTTTFAAALRASGVIAPLVRAAGLISLLRPLQSMQRHWYGRLKWNATMTVLNPSASMLGNRGPMSFTPTRNVRYTTPELRFSGLRTAGLRRRAARLGRVGGDVVSPVHPERGRRFRGGSACIRSRERLGTIRRPALLRLVRIRVGLHFGGDSANLFTK
jgi:hypothetical protein